MTMYDQESCVNIIFQNICTHFLCNVYCGTYREVLRTLYISCSLVWATKLHPETVVIDIATCVTLQFSVDSAVQATCKAED